MCTGSEDSQANAEVLHYFVDEAGDTTLFARRKRLIVGTEGCSAYFMLGKLDVADPVALSTDLEALRAELLAEPYFKNVPSMRPEAGKTASAFHAKDDRPEVRREVFKLLMKPEHDLRLYAVVRDKIALADYVKQRNERDPSYRYRQNEVYDTLVTELFRTFHGVVDFVDICYAIRGTKPRTKAFEAALVEAERKFERGFGFKHPNRWAVRSRRPKQEAGLQAVDYFLWALQRFYERQEDGFVEMLWDRMKLVHDLDFIEDGRRGVQYGPKKPLTLTARERKKNRRI
jgi:hypothetical protein